MKKKQYEWVMVQNKVTGEWRKHSKHNSYNEAVAEMIKLILMFPKSRFRISRKGE